MRTRSSRGALARLRAARRELDDARDALVGAEIAAGDRAPSRRAVPVVVGCVALAAVILAAFAVWRAVDGPPRFTDEQYVQAATDRVRLLVEADADDPTRARRILAGATGDFHDSFAQSADAYTRFVATAGVHGTGTVDAAALARRDGDAALVLVVAGVDTTGGAAAVPRPPLRLRALIRPEGDSLKLAGLEMLP